MNSGNTLMSDAYQNITLFLAIMYKIFLRWGTFINSYANCYTVTNYCFRRYLVFALFLGAKTPCCTKSVAQTSHLELGTRFSQKKIMKGEIFWNPSQPVGLVFPSVHPNVMALAVI